MVFFHAGRSIKLFASLSQPSKRQRKRVWFINIKPISHRNTCIVLTALAQNNRKGMVLFISILPLPMVMAAAKKNAN